jgi:hypothetical protein
MRYFETGATRDTDEGKLDFEGFLSPRVLYRFAEYMHHHRRQADGVLRASDNWQKGIPREAYMKSLTRHFMELWLCWREGVDETINDILCAILFNTQGLLHERLGATIAPSSPVDVEDRTDSTCLRTHLGRGCGLAYDNIGPEGVALTANDRAALWNQAHHPVDRRGRVSLNERW